VSNTPRRVPTRLARAKVERLYWRAGFGALPGAVDGLARAGMSAAVRELLHPRGPQLRSAPAPTVDGQAIDPVNVYSHDVLWWLDRMVRGRHQLVERMTLNWHDHFATSNEKVGDSRLMMQQYFTIRSRSLGSFRKLAQAMLRDHAMQRFLDLDNSDKDDPNENFARELLELFTLGVNNGYTEKDIREAARALTGFTYNWDAKAFGYDPERHDDGVKSILGKTGRFTPADVVNLAVNHPKHAPYICTKIWRYFTPRPCPPATLKKMVAAYRRSGTQIRPVLQIILTHPALMADLGEPDQVKPPAVYVAGMLRKTNQTVTTDNWTWMLDDMGQRPFYPPNVSGWEQDERWLTTASVRSRYEAASQTVRAMQIKDGTIATTQTPAQALSAALRMTGRPWTSAQSRAALARYARSSVADKTADWQGEHYWPERLRVLCHTLLAGPDSQVC
jgi:uncharacterized protein (DUF1800 family)